MDGEFPDVQAGFRNGRGTRDQIANIHWIIEKAREFQKMSTSALLTVPKPLTLLDHLTCLLRNLYAGQEETEQTWDNRLLPNWERSTLRLCIV